MSLLRTLFSFSGRMDKGEYQTVSFCSLIAFAFGIDLAVRLMNATGSDSLSVAAGTFGLVLLVTYVWIELAATAKRLHDTGASGALCLLTFVPLLNLLLFAVMCHVDGTEGPNHYGSPTS